MKRRWRADPRSNWSGEEEEIDQLRDETKQEEKRAELTSHDDHLISKAGEDNSVDEMI